MVSFGKAIKTCLIDKIFNYQDRGSRSEFWWFILFTWLMSLVLAPLQLFFLVGQIIAFIFSIWLFLASVSVSVRRMHDLNRSGWWLLFPYACMILGGIVALTGLVHIGIALLILGGIAIIALWIMMIFRGTAGTNRFGEDPVA